jgi:RHS repeat-associated protein
MSMVVPTGTVNYSYDAADQLLTAGGSTFAYDGNGNRVSRSTSRTSFSRFPKAISSMREASAGYTVTYGWDALNRLVSVTGGGANTLYEYAGDGTRVSQQINAGTYAYVNDVAAPLPVVLNESGPDGNISYAYGSSLISASGPGLQSFYQFDGLGSVATVTDQSASQTAGYAYDPWGVQTEAADALGAKNKYRYTGEAIDPESGLVFLRARYYDPSLGRFLSSDPLGALMPSNAYVYANASPTNLVDPTGLSSDPVGMTLPAASPISTPASDLTAQDLLRARVPSQPQMTPGLSERIDSAYTIASRSGAIIATCSAATKVHYVLGASCITLYTSFGIPRAINTLAPQFGNALGNAYLYLGLPIFYAGQ